MTDRVGFGKNGAYFSSLSAGTYYGPSATALKSGNFVVAEGETLFLSASNMIPGDTVEIMQVVDGLATPYYPMPFVRIVLKDTMNVVAVGFAGTYCMVMSAPALGRVGVEVTIDCDADYCCWLDMYKNCWNRAPVVLSVPDQFQQVGDVVSYDVSKCFFDPDGDTLTYTAVGAVPATLLLDPVTGVLSGAVSTAGVTTVTILADDGNGGLSTCDFTVYVNQPPVAPALGPFADTCTAGDHIEFSHGGFTDADNNPLTLSISGLPTGLSFVDNGGGSYTISGTCPLAAVYTYTVTGRDGQGGVVVLAGNTVTSDAAPMCPTGQVTVPVGAGKPFTFDTPQITDPTGGAIALVAAGVPVGMTFTDNADGTGTISGPMTANVGLYIIRITATDSVGNTCTFTTVVESLAPNLPPVCPANILAPNAMVGAIYTLLTNTVTDPEAGPLVLSAAGVPAGLAFIDNADGTGSFNGTPTTAGTDVVTITASDDNGNTCTYTVTIIIDPATASLTCAPPDVTNVSSGDTINFTVGPAQDTGGGPITLVAANVPAGLVFTDNGNGTGSATGVITEPVGTIVMSVQATGGVPVQNCFMTVDFIVAATAMPPVCPADASTAAAVGAAFSVTTGAVTDPNAGAITLVAVGVPAGVTFVDNGDGTGTFTGPATTVGTSSVSVTATSPGGTCSYNYQFVIGAAAGNAAPTCPANQLVAGLSGSVLALTTPAVTDADGDPIALAAPGLPAGATFTDNGDGTGTFGGTFAAVAGTTVVTITASDGNTGTCTFDVAINSSAVGNVAPTCPINQALPGTVGGVISFTTPAVTDFDGDPVSLAASGLPGGVTFTDNGNGTGTFGGVFPAVGASVVTITAADGNGGACTFDVTISSTAGANTGPVCPLAQATSGSAGTALLFTTPAVTDVDGDPITLTTGALPGGVVFTDNGDGTATFSGTFPAAGVFTASVFAGDNAGGSCTFDVVVTSNAVSAVTAAAVCVLAGGGAFTVGWPSPPADLSASIPTQYSIIQMVTPSGGTGPYKVDFGGMIMPIQDQGAGIIDGNLLSWVVETRPIAGIGSWTAVASGTSPAGVGGTAPASATTAAGAVPAGGQARIRANPSGLTPTGTSLFAVLVDGGPFGNTIAVTDSLSVTGTVSPGNGCTYNGSFNDV